MPARKNKEIFILNAIETHGDMYVYDKVVYINSLTRVIINCRIHGEFEQTPKQHLKGSGCQECGQITKAEKKKLTNNDIDVFLSKNNRYIKRIDNFINVETKIRFLCLKCDNIWLATPHIIKSGCGCPRCQYTLLSDKFKSSNYELDRYIINNNLKVKRIGQYERSNIKIDFECSVCNHVWKAIPNDIKCGKGCPLCINKNEKLIFEYLQKYNIDFTHQFKIKLNNKNIRVDFYVPSINLIIEYNGAQHYEPVRFGGIEYKYADAALEKQQNRDNMLREFCNTNGINLLEIDGREYFSLKLEKFLQDYFS